MATFIFLALTTSSADNCNHWLKFGVNHHLKISLTIISTKNFSIFKEIFKLFRKKKKPRQNKLQIKEFTSSGLSRFSRHCLWRSLYMTWLRVYPMPLFQARPQPSLYAIKFAIRRFLYYVARTHQCFLAACPFAYWPFSDRIWDIPFLTVRFYLCVLKATVRSSYKFYD